MRPETTFHPAKILAAVQAHFRVSHAEIMGKQRSLVLARCALAYMLHTYGGLSYTEIMTVMGRRTPSHRHAQAVSFSRHPNREFIVHRLLMRLDPAYKRSCKIEWASWETVARKEAA